MARCKLDFYRADPINLAIDGMERHIHVSGTEMKKPQIGVFSFLPTKKWRDSCLPQAG